MLLTHILIHISIIRARKNTIVDYCGFYIISTLGNMRKFTGGFNFSDVFTAKEKVWSISEDKYQNTPRVRVILLKAVCWT